MLHGLCLASKWICVTTSAGWEDLLILTEDATRFHDVIRCDEGGWVHIEDLVKMEVLWTAQSRQITTTASHTDEGQRKRIYNERVQLLINGNLLGARQRNGKQRFQFLGVRLKDPPAGPYNLGVPGSNMMVSKEDQIAELMHNRYTRNEQQWLGPCDGWIRPWAVRAVSGHSVHPDPEKNLMELDPHKSQLLHRERF